MSRLTLPTFLPLQNWHTVAIGGVSVPVAILRFAVFDGHWGRHYSKWEPEHDTIVVGEILLTLFGEWGPGVWLSRRTALCSSVYLSVTRSSASKRMITSSCGSHRWVAQDSSSLCQLLYRRSQGNPLRWLQTRLRWAKTPKNAEFRRTVIKCFEL